VEDGRELFPPFERRPLLSITAFRIYSRRRTTHLRHLQRGTTMTDEQKNTAQDILNDILRDAYKLTEGEPK